MITYTVDVQVPNDRVDEWMQYMTSTHIEDVVRTGCFLSAVLHRVIEPIEEGNCRFRVVYALQSTDHLHRYRQEFAADLQKHHTQQFGASVVATRSVTEEVIRI